MKILVTGGTGFIGSAVTVALRDRGFEPLIMARQASRATDKEVFLADVCDQATVTEAAAHADAIIHLAGVLGTQETVANPVPAAHTNIIGGLNVINAAVEYKLPLVNISVGNWFEFGPYSASKYHIERMIEGSRRDRGLSAVTVRGMNVYGPGQSVYGHGSKVRKITPSFVCRALEGEPIEVYGDGGQIMDMIYIDDMARVLVAAMEWLIANPEGLHRDPMSNRPPAIDAGTGDKTTVKYIANIVADRVSRFTGKPPVGVSHLPMRPGERPGAVVFADTATMAPLVGHGLDPHTFTRFASGIEPTIRHYAERFGG